MSCAVQKSSHWEPRALLGRSKCYNICDFKMNEKDVGHLFQEEPIDYNQFRIEGENVFCIKCGKPAEYKRWGFTWCEEHKRNIEKDPEELERIVIRRFKE